MQRCIVVPLDGSRAGEVVLPLAVELAKRQHADLELVHAFEALPPYMVQGAPPIDPALDQEIRRQRQRYLEDVANRLRGAASINIACRTLDGTDVVATLADYLAERRPDLTILATHGRGGVGKLWVGSVPTGLLRHSTGSLLLVRATDSALPNEANVTRRRILVPLDLTPADENALDDVVALSAPGETEFFLLHVREPVTLSEQDATTPDVPPVYDVDPTRVAPYATSVLEAAADDYLEQVARRIRRQGFVVTSQVVADRSPADAILKFADAWQIDLLVLEPHLRTRVSRLLPGHVIDKVIHATRVPVLIHRRPADRDQHASTVTDRSAKTTV